MDILAFDTSFDACSACVARARDGIVVDLASALERFQTGHAERLVPMIDEVMARAGVSFDDLDRIAVTVGPGTFTGTRIGIAAARGLALATGIPLVGASSLAVMAQAASRAPETLRAGSELPDADLMVAVDARRAEVYVQLFRAGTLDARTPPQLLPVAQAARLSGSVPIIIAGSGAEAVAAAARSSGRRAAAILPDLLPDAGALAHIAASLTPADAPLQPLYLRPPDAKPQDGKSIPRAQP